MPSYFGRDMTDAEYEAQIAVDDLALQFGRSNDDAERKLLRAEATTRGVSDALWDETMARVTRYLGAGE